MVENRLPRGGKGGDASAIGPTGIAIGGNGGRGGAPGFGAGGGGGGGGTGGDFSRGGDGGDAGRPGRPALGARSALAYEDVAWAEAAPSLKDEYGLWKAGRGGDSYVAYVTYEGRSYCMNVLLHLLREKREEVIDAIDSHYFETEQQWWNRAVEEYPNETKWAMYHMRCCEDGS